MQGSGWCNMTINLIPISNQTFICFHRYLRCYDNVRTLIYHLKCFSNALNCPVLNSRSKKSQKNILRNTHTDSLISLVQNFILIAEPFNQDILVELSYFCFTQCLHMLYFYLYLWRFYCHVVLVGKFPFLHSLSSPENFLY